MGVGGRGGGGGESSLSKKRKQAKTEIFLLDVWFYTFVLQAWVNNEMASS